MAGGLSISAFCLFTFLSMKKRVLLIDNDSQLNKINEKVLLTSNFVGELHIATNGLKAAEYINWRVQKQYPLPDIIILELNLPLMDGFEFMEWFQAADIPGKANVELVVFTASSSPRDKQRALCMGVQYYLNKPYLLRGLAAVVESMKGARAMKN